MGLRVHQRTHSGEKPLKCTLCLKAFADPSGLRHHIKRHHPKTKEREKKEKEEIQEIVGPPGKPKRGNRQCGECKKWFADGYRLRIHQRIHSGEKPLECEGCGRTFSDPSNFKKHIRKCQKNVEQNSCHLCDDVVGSNGALQMHIEEVHGGVVLD